MANRVSDWQGLLETFNETLAPQGKVILVEQNDDESGYNISVSMPNGKKEVYAENYYEDELCNVLNDALSWAISYEIPVEKKDVPENVIVLSVVDTEYERHILHVYKGKNLSEIRGEDLLPVLRDWAEDDGNCEEFENDDELNSFAEMIATETIADSKCGHTYELDYVTLTIF